jgi:NPCBM/NEW2 domain
VAEGEEEIGPVPAPSTHNTVPVPAPFMPPGGSPGGRPPARNSISALLGVLLAVIAVAGITVGALVAVGGGSRSSRTSIATEPGSTSTTSTARLVYLSRLVPSGGDTPMVGNARLDGHDYPNSLLYENVDEVPSIAASCDSQAFCRATSYELGGRFTQFLATLGTETGGSPAEQRGYLRWSVVVDGTPATEGTLTPRSALDSIDVPLAGADNLALRVIVEDGFAGTIVWGNARVH